MTVQFFDFDVETPDLVPLRIYLIGQEPPEPRTKCSVPLLQSLGDRFSAAPRLDGLLRVEVVAVDANHTQHVLFDSTATSTIELLRPTEVLAGRFRRSSGDLVRRVEDGLSLVVLPGDLDGTELASQTTLVNDVQTRLLWIEHFASPEGPAGTHQAWSATRTVVDSSGESTALNAVVASFISTVVEAAVQTAAEWLASPEVSSLVEGMSYVVE